MSHYIELTDPNHILRATDEIAPAHCCAGPPGNWGDSLPLQRWFSHFEYIGKTIAEARLQAVTPFRFRCKVEDVIVTEIPSPSEFTPMHNGDRFQVRILSGQWQVYGSELEHIALCDRSDYAGMIARSLNESSQIAELTAQRNMAIQHLAEWCVAIDVNGSGWDDWDEYYKDVMYDRPNRLQQIRDLLKSAIEEARHRAFEDR